MFREPSHDECHARPFPDAQFWNKIACKYAARTIGDGPS
jgi:hypothetical protein